MSSKPLLALTTAAILAAGVFTWHRLALAQSTVSSPTLIPFQGLITNQQGQLQGSGQYSIIFNLYDAAVGGQPIWSERHAKVGVINGQVNVFLGSINTTQPLAGISFSTVKYLGITVDVDDRPTTPDPEMVPRQIIVPSFYAKNAENLAGRNWTAILADGSNDPSAGFLNGARIKAESIGSTQIENGSIGNDELGSAAVGIGKIANGAIGTAQIADFNVTRAKLETPVQQALVPAGTILPFAGTAAPAGYVLCDGAAYAKTGGQYAALFAAIGTNFGAPDASNFNVPDLRGQFLRGAMPNIQATATGNAGASNVITTAAAHSFNRTGMRVKVSGPALGGLSATTEYFIIPLTGTTLALAATAANAQADSTRVTVAGSVNGMLITQAEDSDVSLRNPSAKGGSANPLFSFLGTAQADELKRHNHQQQQTLANAPPEWGEIIQQNFTGSTPGKHFTLFAGGSETRPRNIAVNYIIKL